MQSQSVNPRTTIVDWCKERCNSLGACVFVTMGYERWAVRKDRGEFDQFTGATITPRAVVAAVLRTLQYAQANRGALFAQPEQQPAGGKS